MVPGLILSEENISWELDKFWTIRDPHSNHFTSLNETKWRPNVFAKKNKKHLYARKIAKITSTAKEIRARQFLSWGEIFYCLYKPILSLHTEKTTKTPT